MSRMTPMERLAAEMHPIPEGRCLVGVSGGADSTAMLKCLKSLSGIEPEAVHINHGLRGDESDGDEAFVRKLCREMDVPLHVFRADLKNRRDENSAREARYSFFSQCAESTGIDTLVLAHHSDDLAETCIMRLLRGTGPEGLGCMRRIERRGNLRILRPMLGIRREEIRNALKEEGIPWREDSSNIQSIYLRNAVRLRLMPIMEEMAPGSAGRIARTCEMISAENEMIDTQVDKFLKDFAGERWIDWMALRLHSAAMQARILRRWVKINSPARAERELSAEQTDALVRLAAGDGRKINLPGGLFAVRGRQALHLTGFPSASVPETPLDRKGVPFGIWKLDILPGGDNPGDGVTVQEIPEAMLKECVIRNRRPGDWIRPFGMSGRRKLSDYLIDRGIDEPWRNEIPLLCRGNEVIWVAGVGTGDVPMWNRDKRNLRLTWTGRMPWQPMKAGKV